MRTSTRPSLNLICIFRAGMVCIGIHPKCKSCYHIRSGFLRLSSMTLLPGGTPQRGGGSSGGSRGGSGKTGDLNRALRGTYSGKTTPGRRTPGGGTPSGETPRGGTPRMSGGSGGGVRTGGGGGGVATPLGAPPLGTPSRLGGGGAGGGGGGGGEGGDGGRGERKRMREVPPPPPPPPGSNKNITDDLLNL